MAASAQRSSGQVLCSVSPLGRFCSSRTSYFFATSSASAFSSSTSTFLVQSFALLHKSTTPMRVNYRNPSVFVRFSLYRSISSNRSILVLNKQANMVQKPGKALLPKKTCMCLPTNHPSSFCCSLHKSFGNSHNHSQTVSYNSNRLKMRRSVMMNSLLKIGRVEGDLVKRAWATLIRTSLHQQHCREHFQSRSSRFSRISKA